MKSILERMQEEEEEESTEVSSRRPKRTRRVRRSRPAEPKQEKAMAPADVIAALRAQLAPIVRDRIKGKPKQAVAMSAAIMLQEAGLPEGADALIENYGLSALGLKKDS